MSKGLGKYDLILMLCRKHFFAVWGSFFANKFPKC